ncbi:MAG: L-seryl-tRNA(Sec) selenium transferase [Anaerolineaceae bacterium 4572_32.1]|nr:MAG: L-seryl-tRNA(Sec) selenium transferase [Anaerolineaceae bacterium 4572_32.1]
MTYKEFRKLPSVDNLLQMQAVQALERAYSHDLVVGALRQALDAARQAISSGEPAASPDTLVSRSAVILKAQLRPTLCPVINATGVIIHTNLGRALLSPAARTAMNQAARAYSNLEYDLEAGKRGSRYTHAESLLCRLTGAEAALVLNNNAGAVLLILSALARETAITEQTVVLLRAHRSNFSMSGFVSEPTLAEMAELAHSRGLLVVDDLGSGTLLDTADHGLAHEPTIQESLSAGADIVSCSGDKLLGGPQAGIVLGRADLVARLRHFPLTRALRVDKTTLAALQATLLHYLKGEALQEIPVWRMIAVSMETLTARADDWVKQLAAAGLEAEILEGRSTVGGGSLPGETLPTSLVALNGPSPQRLAAALRRADPPVIARIENEQLLLDPRTVQPEEEETLLETVIALAQEREIL